MTNRGHTIGATIWTHAGWITLRASIALVLGALLVFGAGRLITSAASVGDRIPIQGLSSDGDGIAVWNTSPDAPEPEQSGHQTSWTSCSAFAPYYLASADFGTPDGMVPAGLRAAPMIEGMAELAMALSTNGFTERDLTMSFGPQTLGADRESHEWRICAHLLAFAFPGNSSRCIRSENTSAPPPGIDLNPASLRRANDSSGSIFQRLWK